MKPKGIEFGTPLVVKVPGLDDQFAVVVTMTKRGFCAHFTNGEAKAPHSPPPKQIDTSRASVEIWLKGEA